MVHSSIQDLFQEVTALIQDENVNNGKVYWWIFFDARATFSLGRSELMHIKLPLPKTVSHGFACEYNRKKYNEKEIERTRAIYRTFIDILAAKIDKVNSGASTVEEEFKDGILLENGTFGLKYKESWPW